MTEPPVAHPPVAQTPVPRAAVTRPAREVDDPFPDRSLALAGGPLGRHAVRRPWVAAVWPLVALAALPVADSVVQKAYCIGHGWLGQPMFWRQCYSDLPVQFDTGFLGRGLTAYLSGRAHVDQPILTGGVMALLGGLVPHGTQIGQQRAYFVLWTLLATVLLMATTWFTAAARPRHAVDAAQVALSPLLLITLLIAPDIVGVALVAAGMWAWARRRPGLAGALLGAAVMARTYPLLVVAALVLLAVRTGRYREVGRLLACAGGVVAALLVVGLVTEPSTLTAAYRSWWTTGASFGSVWFIPQLAGHPLPIWVATTAAVVGLGVALCAGFVLALGAPRRPTWAEVALVVVALALVTGKTLPVQSTLWLLPLAALCGIRWRDHLVWVGMEAMHFVAVWLYIGGFTRPSRGLPPAWYAFFLLLRIAGIAYLTWRVWQGAMEREPHTPDPGWPEDPDRDEVVDELAGPLTGAPDRLVAVSR